ncbi:MAG: HD-GYP domain-containing protein [Firmicutes bacterium]|nr:HD-GYP domain-containing protein [Dethiobacter sp.]MBS3888141.1 HD-GYP domain-containing protein [Bacillota bacterium]
MTLKLRLYVYTVIALGVILLIGLGLPESPAEVTAIVVFGVIAMLFEALSIEALLGKSTISVSYVPIITVALLFDVQVAAWVGALSSLNVKEIMGGKPLLRNLFNFAQVAVSGAAAGAAYAYVGGSAREVDMIFGASVVVGVLALLLVNALLTGVAVSLSERVGLVKVLRLMLGSGGLAYVVTAPLAVLTAVLYIHVGYVGVILSLLPLFLARMSLKLYRDMRQHYLETVQALAQAIDAKDTYTRGHSGRVGIYAVDIARRMGWQGDKLEQMYFTALLHDIGKIGVRDHVLTKDGRLSQAERAEINNHPSLGADIVLKIAYLKEGADYIRHHHEHFSGEGYPSQLAGETIPLGARIIAVADAFDAMTSVRSYQDPRTLPEALQELRHCSGSQFDPEVVETFVGALRSYDDIAEYTREAAAVNLSSLAGVSLQ